MIASARSRLLATERELRSSHPTCRIMRYAAGSPLTQSAAIQYLRKVGDITMVAKDRNEVPHRSVLLIGGPLRHLAAKGKA